MINKSVEMKCEGEVVIDNALSPFKVGTSVELSDSDERRCFLGTGSPPPNTMIKGLESQHQESYGDIKINNVNQDIDTLTKTQLRKKYPLSYGRWKNMKSRRKIGAIIDPRFECFIDFLGYMGPVPNESFTLDRIDNSNNAYSPENCRWADKYTQNSNKGNNVYITHEGETRTVAQWASITSQKANTLYKRKREGWTDEEVVTGIREKLEADPWSKTPWPKGKEMNWERRYQGSEFPAKNESRIDFLIGVSGKVLIDLNHLFQESCGSDSVLPENLIADIAYWEALNRNAKEHRSLSERRKTFISRNGSKDSTEAALFDLVNPSTMTFNDMSDVSRSELSESITNQEES